MTSPTGSRPRSASLNRIASDRSPLQQTISDEAQTPELLWQYQVLNLLRLVGKALELGLHKQSATEGRPHADQY